jgi:hypothetical protein
MIMGTSVPTWYDGGMHVYSSAPLESPELVGASIVGAQPKYIAYQQLETASSNKPKLYSAVLITTDESGRVHRSAPSIPVYLGGLDAASATGTVVTLRFTPILSLQRHKSALLEVYEALPGDTFQLAGSTQLSPNLLDGAAGASWDVQIQTVVDPSATTTYKNVSPWRASKTLYTEGNVLAADPWPNFDFVVKSGRRLFAHSIGDPNTIYYSKTF